MTLQVTFRRAARAELMEAAAWYEAQRPNLGAEFIAEIERCGALAAICRSRGLPAPGIGVEEHDLVPIEGAVEREDRLVAAEEARVRLGRQRSVPTSRIFPGSAGVPPAGRGKKEAGEDAGAPRETNSSV